MYLHRGTQLQSAHMYRAVHRPDYLPSSPRSGLNPFGNTCLTFTLILVLRRYSA